MMMGQSTCCVIYRRYTPTVICLRDVTSVPVYCQKGGEILQMLATLRFSLAILKHYEFFLFFSSLVNRILLIFFLHAFFELCWPALFMGIMFHLQELFPFFPPSECKWQWFFSLFCDVGSQIKGYELWLTRMNLKGFTIFSLFPRSLSPDIVFIFLFHVGRTFESSLHFSFCDIPRD